MSEQNEALSNTPYDDAFRTLVTRGGNLIIPFINELFKGNEPVKMNAKIIHEANEQFLNLGKGKQEKGATDSIILIDGEPYHVECQSRDDGTILVRIAKYDWLEAIRNSTIEGNEIKIHLPYSGLLYLRKTDQTPESLYVHYYDNYGHELKYPVRVLNLADYSLDDLVDKNLIFLLPFYLFNLEKELKSYDETESRQRIITSYDDLIRYLNELQAQDKISVYIYSLVTEMLRKVTDNLAKNNDRARKELDELMGGKILEFKNEKVYDEGRVDTLVTLVHNGTITAEVAAKQAAEFGISSEEFNKKLKAYADDEVLMQG